MKLRIIVPIVVLLIAAFFGWRAYERGDLRSIGLAPPQSEVVGFPPNSPEDSGQVSTTPSEQTGSQQNNPQQTDSQGPGDQSSVEVKPNGSTKSPIESAGSSGYPEADLREPDIRLSANLRPSRREIVEAYEAKRYAEALALSDAWLNSRPTDALIALVRSNAVAGQLNRPVIRLGLSVPTSGPSVQAGEAILQGVNLAVSEANQSTIQGRRVVVEVLNDQNDRERAIEVATQFAGDETVLGVIGPVGSSAALAAASLYNASDLPELLPTATDDRLSSVGALTYRLAPPNAAQGRAMARLVQMKEFVRVPVYYDPIDAYSKSLADAFRADATKLGVSTVPVAFSSGVVPTDEAFGVFADSPSPDAAFIAGAYADVARIATAMRERDIDVPLFAGDAAYSQQLLSEGGTAVEGLTMLSFFHATAEVGETASFVRRFAARYGGGIPNARAAQAYDAARTLIEAVRRAEELSRTAVGAALQSFSSKPGQGVTSSVRFQNGAIQGRPFVVIRINQGKLVVEATIR